jgi:hypothetical protein
MKNLTLLIFLFTSLTSCSQTKKVLTIKEFTSNWIIDSLGKTNFRNTHNSYSKTKSSLLLNNIDIRGFDKNKVLNLLGKPNESEIHKEDKLLIMTYKTKNNKASNRDGEILIYFDEKDKVVAVLKVIDNPKLYIKK